MSNHYTTLGVDKTANQDEIKKAFRKLAHKYHPDKKGGDEAKFKEINQAYQVLGDQKKKEQYDQFGNVFEGGQPGVGGSDFNSFNQDQGGFDFGGINLEDILRNVGFGFSGRGRKQDLSRGNDIQVSVKLNLGNVLTGLEQTVIISKMVECQRCKGQGGEPGTNVKECFACRGKGWVEQVKRTILGSISQQTVCPDCKGEGKVPEKPCNVCNGEGRIKQDEKINVFIPSGVDTGQVLKVDGKGDAGKRGGEHGDLFIKIFVKQHKIFRRRGDDLIVSVPVTFSTATLGGEVNVPALDSKQLSLKVPAGIKSGKVLRLSGKGIPHFNGWGTGAMFIELVLDTPSKLNRKQKDLLKQLQKEGL